MTKALYRLYIIIFHVFTCFKYSIIVYRLHETWLNIIIDIIFGHETRLWVARVTNTVARDTGNLKWPPSYKNIPQNTEEI